MISAMAVAVCIAIVATGCSGSSQQESGFGPATGDPVVDSARALTEKKCTLCHTIDRIVKADKTPEGWKETVDRMKSNGLVITEQEEQTIIDFLAK